MFFLCVLVTPQLSLKQTTTGFGFQFIDGAGVALSPPGVYEEKLRNDVESDIL